MCAGVGCVCSLANYSVAYEETQSNRVSEFRDIVCSLFPRTILFYSYFYPSIKDITLLDKTILPTFYVSSLVSSELFSFQIVSFYSV